MTFYPWISRRCRSYICKVVLLITLNLLFIILLIAFTGFFVATEFAIVKVRMVRIEQLISEGKKGAHSAKIVLSHIEEYLSACQLGITVTALGLGWLGEPTVTNIFQPLFNQYNVNESLIQLLSFCITFGIITFLHVVVGELAPKSVAIQKAEEIILFCSLPIIWFYRVMYPFIWILNGAARIFVGLFGLSSASKFDIAHSEEELRILLSESFHSGEINQNELNYVNNIFAFDERIAKEVMVPRTEIVSISMENTYEEVINIVTAEKYTRYPVIQDSDKDNILGFINIKEFLTAMIMHKTDKNQQSFQSFINPIIQVIETVPIHDLLVKMQKERTHIAILIDEYGGTSGLVTVEDILEEIVGEIRDEFDEDEIPEIQKVSENHYILDAKILIDEVNNLLGVELEDEEIDTIGGWFLTRNFEAKAGSEIQAEGYIFRIKTINGHHISYIEVVKSQ